MDEKHHQADLHIHTTCSDGVYSPSDVVKKAAQKGITHISIADHDTINGIAEAKKTAEELGLYFYNGIEVSTQYDNKEYHVLGYHFDPYAPELTDLIKKIKENRVYRAKSVIRKLNILDVDITFEEVVEHANTDVIGRPHIAETMVMKRIVNNFYDAFNKYLSDKGPAFVAKAEYSTEDAIAAIKDSGGVAILAHPGLIDEKLVHKFVDIGLDGLEVIHPSHTAQKIRRLKSFTKKYMLLESGGSDFHGGDRFDEHNLGKYHVNPIWIDNMLNYLSKK